MSVLTHGKLTSLGRTPDLEQVTVVLLSTNRVQLLEKQENRSMGVGGYGSNEVWELGSNEAGKFGGFRVVQLSTDRVQLLEKQDNLVVCRE